MRKLLAILFSAVLLTGILAGCGGNSASQEENKTLRVGMDAAYPPFGSQNPDTKEYEGFDIDIIKAIADEEGMDAKIDNRAFDGLIPALEAKDIDVAINDITITDERKKNVAFSKPYYIAGLDAVIRSDDNRFQKPEDLEGKILGVTIGSTGEEAARKIPNADVRVFNSLNDAFMELQNGGVDAVINDLPTNEYFIAHTNNKNVRAANLGLTKEDLGIAVAKDNKELLAKIDDGLQKIKDNGKFTEIYKKWFGQELPAELLQN